MRTTVFSLLILIGSMAMFPYASLAQDSRPIVRLIYFVPSDREAQPDIDAKLDTLIKDTQRFFADQMEAHGFERKTFLFETDASGKAVVHHIKGKSSDIEYKAGGNYWVEIGEKFDFPPRDIRLVALESSLQFNIWGLAMVCGWATVGAGSGSAVINNRCFDVLTFAHELGHTFGLAHDSLRTAGKWIPSALVDRADPMTTSFCAAEWLDGHPAFNTGGNAVNKNSTVKMLPPSLTSPDNAIRLRFEVSDPDGLHQVQLITIGRDKFDTLVDFKGLSGNPDSTVEFITTELPPQTQKNLHSVRLYVMDMNGNVLWTYRRLINVSFLLPPSEVVSGPDPHSDVAVRYGVGGSPPTHTTLSLPEGAKARLGKGGILGMAYSPDGTRLAVASSIGAWLYDAQTFQAISLFTGHTGYVNSVAFSPDGGTLASGSQDNTIRLWDVSTGRLRHTLRGHRDKVQYVAFSPNGRTLASVGSGSARLWDVRKGSLVRTFIDLNKGVGSHIPLPTASVAISPDGQTVASATGLKASTDLWDLNTGNLRHTLRGHTDSVRSVAFSPDGRTLVSGSEDKTIRLWNVETGEHVSTFTGSETVNSVAFGPDGRTLASGHGHTVGRDRGTINLWDVETGKSLHALTGHTYYMTSVVFSPDRQTLATGSGDGTLRFWNPRTGQLLHTLTGHTYYMTSVAFSPDGQALVTASRDPHQGSDPAIHLWDVGTASLRYSLTGHTFHKVHLSPDGLTLASASRDGTIGLWDVDTGSLRSTLIGHAHFVWSLSFSPNGQTLASASHDGVIGLWDIGTASLLRSIIPSVFVPSVVFSPDGQTIVGVTSGDDAGAERSAINLWEVDTGNLRRTFTEFPGYGAVVAYSPDGQSIAASGSSGGKRGIRLWDVDTGNLRHRLGFHDHYSVLAFSPDGQTLAGGSERDGTFYLWDVDAGSRRYIFAGHRAWVHDIAFSPDGRTLASASEDGTALLWDIAPTRAEPEKIVGDVNGDGNVNIQDLVAVAAALGQTGENDADVNGDGKVNIQDLVAVAAEIGGAAAAPPVMRQQVPGQLTQADVQQWITQARQAKLTDATSQRGILFLQQLLVALAPKETALLPNYPNPFNPETWIPYRLAEDAVVTLTIHDLNGQVVRTLDIGRRSAAVYERQSDAIYWDGKNDLGEPVGSGVYFYHLSAGDYSATRKMVILK